MRPNQTLRHAKGERRLSINAYLNDNVLRERFESLATGLSDGDRDVAGLAGIDVAHSSRFAFVRTTDD